MAQLQQLIRDLPPGNAVLNQKGAA
jgi:hypothetical protein